MGGKVPRRGLVYGFAPMPRSRRIAVLVSSLALALPASALAQGAGDNQYTDPFAGENGSGSGSGSGSHSGSGSGSQGGAEGSNGSQLSSTMPGQQASSGQ